MSNLSSKTFLAAVETYAKVPTLENREALFAAADEYHTFWNFGQSSDSTPSRKHATNVSGTPTRKQKFDVSRIMDDLQVTSA